MNNNTISTVPNDSPRIPAKVDGHVPFSSLSTVVPPALSPQSLPNVDYPTYISSSLDQSYVGFDQTYRGNPLVEALFSPSNLECLRQIIREGCHGADSQGREVMVTDRTITSCISNVLQNGRRINIGDIHSRFIVSHDYDRNDFWDINRQVSVLLIQMIRDEFETIANNQRLSIWDSVYGDFNRHQLRAYAPLKIRRKYPQHMMFNMNY